jgi:transcriptional regulator with XRE-family HTH domain
METIRDLIGKNFNRLVNASPLTNREIAKLVGVNEATFYRWQNNESCPELPNIEKLAQVLNIDPLEFYKTEEQTKGFHNESKR